MSDKQLKCPQKLECIHVDTCLSCYWGGHHLAHVQIPVWNGMKLNDVKRALHSEVSQGAIAGNEPLTFDDSGIEGDKFYKKMHAAIDRIKLADKRKRKLFTDLEIVNEDDDCMESVYAFFVFEESF